MKKAVFYAEKYFRIYFIFIVFMLPLVFLQRSEDAYYLPKAILLLTGLQYLFFIAANIKKIKFGVYDAALVVFLLLYAAGLPGPERGFFKYFEWVAAASMYFYAKFFLNRREIQKVIYAALLSSSSASAYALLQVFGIDFAGWFTDFSGRAFSSFGNPDFFGGFLVMAIPLALFPGLYGGRKKVSFFLYVFFASALVLSQTRSSLAAFAAGAFLTAWIFRKHIRGSMKYIAAGIMIVTAAVVVSGKGGLLSERVAAAADIKNRDLAGRVEMWKTGIKITGDNLLTGAGINNIRNIYHRHKTGGGYYETNYLHNDYINIAAESGVFAGAAFIVFLFLLSRALASRKKIISAITLVSFASLFIHAFLNFPFYILGTKLYFFVLAGCALNKNNTLPGAGPRSMAVAAVFNFALLVVLLPVLYGNTALNYGINALFAGKNNAAGKLLKTAEKYSFRPEADYYLAEYYHKAGDYKKGAARAEKFLDKRPASKRGAVKASVIYAEKRDYTRALSLLDDFLRFYPADTAVLNNKGKILFMKGKIKEAAGIYEKVIEKDPANAVAHSNIYAIYYNTGMYEEAEKEKQRWENINK